MTRGAPEVPDALAAVIAAVEQEFPHAEPHRKAVLIQNELRRQGWHIGAPGRCRPTPITKEMK